MPQSMAIMRGALPVVSGSGQGEQGAGQAVAARVGAGGADRAPQCDGDRIEDGDAGRGLDRRGAGQAAGARYPGVRALSESGAGKRPARLAWRSHPCVTPSALRACRARWARAAKPAAAPVAIRMRALVLTVTRDVDAKSVGRPASTEDVRHGRRSVHVRELLRETRDGAARERKKIGLNRQ